jgi:xylulokinase
MLAAAAVGLQPGIRQAGESMSSTTRVYEPDDARRTTYDGLYRTYRQLYPRLREVFHELSTAGAP